MFLVFLLNSNLALNKSPSFLSMIKQKVLSWIGIILSTDDGVNYSFVVAYKIIEDTKR